MPVQPTYPGVYIEELPSGVRTITGVATSIALFIGWAARGPIDRAVRLSSFSDYERRYGGLDLRSELGYAVKHFFDNGGSDAYVIRIVKNDATTAGASINGLKLEATSPGGWAGSYKIGVTRRAAPADKRFKIEVLFQPTTSDTAVVVESFEDLSIDENDKRYVATAINNRSAIISVTDIGTAPPDTTATPVPLNGGVDGGTLEANDADFLSRLSHLFDAGAAADQIDIFNLVCVPGLTSGTPGSNTAIQNLQKACADRRAFLIIDSKEPASIADMVTAVGDVTGSSPRNAALYYPWVLAPDPLQLNALRAFPPCGFVAGVMARTDSARGVWKAPAGVDASLNGAAGFTVMLSDQQNGQLNPSAVNCLRSLPVYGRVVWGARTLEGDDQRASEWKYIPVRRMALFLEESLYRGTQWVVFEPNDEPLWAQIRLNVGTFMQNLFRQGAFQGASPRDAYFVKCDKETTTQADIDRGIVNIVVGFAPLKPAEFVIIQLQQMAGTLAA